MKNKHIIMNILYKKDIMRTMHENLLDGLVGSLQNEYNNHFPATPTACIKPPSMLRAVMNMFVANIMHHFTEDLIEEVIDTILENQDLFINDAGKSRQ